MKNESLSMMRSSIINLAVRNERANIKIQEQRNLNNLSKKPGQYRVIDMIEDVRKMNCEQFFHFMDSFNVYDRKRVDDIFEQYSSMVEDLVAYDAQGLYLFEGVSSLNKQYLIESQLDVQEKMLRELQRRLSETKPEDIERTKALKKSIAQTEMRISNLKSMATKGAEFKDAKKEVSKAPISASSGKAIVSPALSKKYLDAAGRLKTAIEKKKELSSTLAKDTPPTEKTSLKGPDPYPKLPPAPKPSAPESAPAPTSAPKPSEPGAFGKFAADYLKHYRLLSGPAPEAAKYYGRRALEIGGSALRGVGKGAAAVGAGTIATVKAAARGLGAK